MNKNIQYHLAQTISIVPRVGRDEVQNGIWAGKKPTSGHHAVSSEDHMGLSRCY